LVPKFTGSKVAEAVGFSGRNKNPQLAFLGGEVKAVLSHVTDLRHVKNPKSSVNSLLSGKIYRPFLAQ
jgi:hypothetical protein